jgi:hypothetical protein
MKKIILLVSWLLIVTSAYAWTSGSRWMVSPNVNRNISMTQNVTGVVWNLENDTSVSKTAGSITGQWENGTANNANLTFSISKAGILTPAMIINNMGMVGINVAPSIYSLEVQNSSVFSARFTNNASSSSSGGSILVLGVNDGAANSGGDRLGAINFMGSEDGVNNTAAAALRCYANSTWAASNIDTYLAFYTTPTGTKTITEQMRITSKGYVGIATATPLGYLQVGGSSFPGLMVTSTNLVGIGNTAPIGYLQVGTSPSAPGLIVTTTGRVGIGTTAPTNVFSIVGGPAYNQALCLNATGGMSSCSSVVGATGGCTCP